MDDRVRRALADGRTIDITTIGRQSGQPRRLEIWYHLLDDTVYITGTPGRRDWYANLQVEPRFTFHLKEGLVADLPARATPVTDPAARRAVFSQLLPRLGHSGDLDAWLAGSPLVAVEFEDQAGAAPASDQAGG